MKRYELGLGSFLRWMVRMGRSCQYWPNFVKEGRETLSESRDMQYKQSTEVFVLHIENHF